MAFEGGFALEEPAGDVEDGYRVMTGCGEGQVVEGVGFDEGSVEVDAQYGRGGDVESGGRDGQNCPSLRLNLKTERDDSWHGEPLGPRSVAA